MSAESDALLQLQARMDAHEHLLRHLIVTVLARTQDPLDAFEGFHTLLAAPIKRQAAKHLSDPDADLSHMRILEIVDWIAKGIRDDIQHALTQVTTRRK